MDAKCFKRYMKPKYLFMILLFPLTVIGFFMWSLMIGFSSDDWEEFGEGVSLFFL